MDYDEKVCKILEELDECVFDLSPSQAETAEDNDNSLMDEAVFPCLLMSKDVSDNSDLVESQKNIGTEQNIDIKNEDFYITNQTIENLTNQNHSMYNEENIFISDEEYNNISEEESSSSKQTEENVQYKRTDKSGKMKHKSHRIDVLVILENDRRKVINVKRYSKVKHLRKKFLKIINKDALYTDKVDEDSEIIFQTYHDKFKTWVDAEQDLVLIDGMNLKVIFSNNKTQKEKKNKRSYTDTNSEDHADVNNYSKHKNKKLKSCVSRFENSWSKSRPSRPPPSQALSTIQSYTYYERRDHYGNRSEKAWRTSKYDCDSDKGNFRKSYINDYDVGSETCNRIHKIEMSPYSKNRLAYNKLPLTSYQQVSITQSYSEELNSFLKIIEKQKTEKSELPPIEKVNEEELLKNNSQNKEEEEEAEEGEEKEEEEEEEEGEVKCITFEESFTKNNEEQARYILLSRQEIELYSARLRINEKHPVQAVQEICASVYKTAPSFEVKEERCPLTKLMRYKYTLNILGNIFTPEKTQFNKKAAKVDAANLFLKYAGFK